MPNDKRLANDLVAFFDRVRMLAPESVAEFVYAVLREDDDPKTIPHDGTVLVPDPDGATVNLLRQPRGWMIWQDVD